VLSLRQEQKEGGCYGGCGMTTHGTKSKYNMGCRCDDCRKAIADYNRELVERHSKLPKSKIPHGVDGYANYRCRCRKCVKIYNAYVKMRLSLPRTPEDYHHGTVHCYCYYKCRCEKCVAAKLAADREHYNKRKDRIIEVPTSAHGTLHGYIYYRCRCAACTEANTLYIWHARQKRKAKGATA